MKLLIITESLTSGGKERRIVELIKGVLKKYKDIRIDLLITEDIIHYKSILKENINIYVIKRKTIKKDPRLIYKFFKLIKKIKPDIIHVWGNMTAYYTIPSKIIKGIPLINNLIADAPPKLEHSVFFNPRLTFFFSDKVIANSKAGILAYKAPLKKSMVIYNGFDFERLKNLQSVSVIKKRFNIETDYVVGMVAAFSLRKDYETYLNSAELVLRKRKDVTFICVGSGNYEKYKTKYKNQPKIKFLGRQQDVENIMNMCDIGVLTSNPFVHGEGISNSLLEFMALGKPVIATDNGGNKELVVNDLTGYIIEPLNPDELFQRTMKLLENENLRKFMGENGKNRIREEFSIDRMISQFNNVYKEILK